MLRKIISFFHGPVVETVGRAEGERIKDEAEWRWRQEVKHGIKWDDRAWGGRK